jgi:hypothetical protein
MDWKLKTLYERIIDRWTELEADYTKVNLNRETITAYFRSDETIETDDKGNLVGQDIYNGAGPWYSRMMATGFQGSLVSKNIAWIRYQMREHELQGIDILDGWVQDIKDYMTDVYQRSNFYDVQPQFTHDGLTTASPLMFGEESIIKRKTLWKPQHFKNVRLYYDADNEIEGVIVRDKTWTAKQIFDTFVKRDDENGTRRKKLLTREVNNALEAGKLNNEFVVYRAVFKASDPIWDGGWQKPTNKRWTWLSVYFLEITQVDNDKRNTPLNDNVGYFSQPFVTWAYDKKPWERSSRSPAFYAIWDCISLQQLDKNWLENVQLKNRPPRFALNSMKGRLSLSPEGEMLVSNEEYDRPPKALDLVGDVDITKEVIEIKDSALRRWFLVDFFQMFTDLVRTQKQPVTATQIWQMAGEKATLLSPAIETHSRYLESCDERMLSIEANAGRGPFNRQTMENITDVVLSNVRSPIKSIGVVPVFIGALAQAQKVSQALKPIQATLEAVAPMFEFWPDARLIFREWDTANDIAEAFDFPQKNIVPKEEYEKILAALNEKRAKDEQLAKALEIAKATKDVSGPVDPNSILGSLAGAAG